MADKITRRQFVRDSAVAGAAIGAGMSLSGGALAADRPKMDTSKILNYNPDTEYRRCGRTGLMVSAVCLGGHSKRLVKIIGGREPEGWMTTSIGGQAFQKNRHDVVTRCIDRGINYVDACCREEILAYSKALKGRRDKMYFGYSWHIKESRFIGFSSHDRPHLKEAIEKYHEQTDVVLTPYTAKIDPAKIVCTHCHGDHRMKVRTVVWDRESGRLLRTNRGN